MYLHKIIPTTHRSHLREFLHEIINLRLYNLCKYCFREARKMEVKNMVHACVHGTWIPDKKWNKIVELIEHNNALIRELQMEIGE